MMNVNQAEPVQPKPPAPLPRAKRFKPVPLWLALVASSAVFAASHLQLLQLPGLFMIGAIAAYAFHRTGRLATAIWIHAGFNATTIALLWPDLF